uniref:Uncharacterized protein n=1 Tax=Anguilla anguilla TaxID=7936 RepID=A0A0E9V0D6_ANGAN
MRERSTPGALPCSTALPRGWAHGYNRNNRQGGTYRKEAGVRIGAVSFGHFLCTQ